MTSKLCRDKSSERQVFPLSHSLPGSEMGAVVQVQSMGPMKDGPRQQSMFCNTFFIMDTWEAFVVADVTPKWEMASRLILGSRQGSVITLCEAIGNHRCQRQH